MKIHKDNIKFIEEVAFQKGKLEAIKEEVKFLKEFKRGQQKWLTYQLIKLIYRINYLEKQLQKEIGEEKQDE
jgi:hypothetical protein